MATIIDKLRKSLIKSIIGSKGFSSLYLLPNLGRFEAIEWYGAIY